MMKSRLTVALRALVEPASELAELCDRDISEFAGVWHGIVENIGVLERVEVVDPEAVEEVLRSISWLFSYHPGSFMDAYVARANHDEQARANVHLDELKKRVGRAAADVRTVRTLIEMDPSDPSTLPAQTFYGGKYDEIVLSSDTVLYRVGNAEREWGQWFTDHPIESEAQYRIDLAVKREWTNPRTGTMPPKSFRGPEQIDLWSYSILIPHGTTVYIGPTGSQGGVFLGGLGPGSKQYFIPKAWELTSKGARVIAKAHFK